MQREERESRTIAWIDGDRYELDDPTTLPDLRSQVERAIVAGGGFVDFTVFGNLPVAVLVTAHSRIVIGMERDTPTFESPIVPPPGIYLVEDL